MLLKSEVSCSSVHGSEAATLSPVDSASTGVDTSSAGCSTASPEVVESRLAVRAALFLGGMTACGHQLEIMLTTEHAEGIKTEKCDE